MADPPAPTLGALDPATRHRLEAAIPGSPFNENWTVTVVRLDDVKAILAAYTAQAAQLAETDQRDSDRLFQVVRLESDLRLAQERIDAQAAQLAAYARLHAAAERWDTVCANDEQAWAEADHELGLAIDALRPSDHPRPQRCRCQFCLAKEQDAAGAVGAGEP